MFMKYKGKEYIEIPSAVALSQVGDALRIGIDAGAPTDTLAILDAEDAVF